jgi:hypothetical protein
MLGGLFLVDASHFATPGCDVERTAPAGRQHRRTFQGRARNSQGIASNGRENRKRRRSSEAINPGMNGEGRSVSEAPFIIDGGKPNSVRWPRRTGRSFISSNFFDAHCVFTQHDATIPGDRLRILRRIADRLSFSCLSCTAWGFSCRTNYFARGELLPRLFTLACTFSKNRRYYFCDTFHRRSFSTATPAFSTRHAAEWCSDFPLANPATHQRSSAIGLG